eukprot:1191275-Prorocentrum_minimum.AAC.1
MAVSSPRCICESLSAPACLAAASIGCADERLAEDYPPLEETLRKCDIIITDRTTTPSRRPCESVT